MFFLFQDPIEFVSTLILILIIILVFNPWGLKDKLFEYVKIDINFNSEKIFNDIFEFIKNFVVQKTGSININVQLNK